MDFLYLGPSSADYRKALECDVWFKAGLVGDQKDQISKLVPYPLVLNRWRGNLLHLASDDLFSQRARSRYGSRLGRVRARFGGMYTLANPAGVIKFHMVLDARLAAMHRIHPIFFFLKPGSDLYDDQPSNVNQEYSDWHKQSVNRIEAEIAPVLTQYFLDETISKEEKAHTVWPAEGLFEFVPKNISPGYAQKLIALAEACTGYHSYIDGRLKQVLVMLKDSPA